MDSNVAFEKSYEDDFYFSKFTPSEMNIFSMTFSPVDFNYGEAITNSAYMNNVFQTTITIFLLVFLALVIIFICFIRELRRSYHENDLALYWLKIRKYSLIVFVPLSIITAFCLFFPYLITASSDEAGFLLFVGLVFLFFDFLTFLSVMGSFRKKNWAFGIFTLDLVLLLIFIGLLFFVVGFLMAFGP